MRTNGIDDPECFAPVTLGRRIGERDLGWLGITEAVHSPDRILRPHAHRYPAITLVRHGCFGLHIGREVVDCSQRGVFFKRGEHRHANRIGHHGAKSLILEIRTDGDRVEERGLPLPADSFWTGDSHVVQLAARIDREFRTDDAASGLALEGMALELTAALLRRSSGRPERVRPRWLGRVEAILHADLESPPGLGEVAAAVGRHPVHVARTFRRHHGCSLGEYQRRARLEQAARALRDSDQAIGTIAVDAGFYDHAHFCRCFKQAFAVPPGTYRASYRRQAAP